MTAYLNTFTGSTIASSNATLNGITFIASQPQVQLVWNLNGYDTSINSPYFAATYIILDATAAASPVLLLPNAQQVSPGEEITLVNVGTNSIAVKAFQQAGQTGVVTLAAGNSVKVVLRYNTSSAGTWVVVSTSAAGGLATIAGLAGRGIAIRASGAGDVIDTVWPVTPQLGGTVILYPSQSSQILPYTDSAQITLASTTSATDPSPPPLGTYYIVKNVSTGRITVQAQVLDNVTNGQVFVAPGSFGIFSYGGSGSWYSLVGAVSQGTAVNSSSGIGYNATIVNCTTGSGAAGSVYTLQSVDFGTVIDFQGVNNNQVVILPARVAVYVVRNSGLGVQQNITFRGAGSIQGNTVVLAGSQYSVLATDGIGNVYPGISSLPGGQLVNAAPGSAAQPGIFFDPDEFSGLYSNGVGNFVGISIAGLEASTFSGSATNLTVTHGTAARPVQQTTYGNLTITGTFNALGGIDGGAI